MDFGTVVPYFAVANFIATWAIGFYVHLVNKNKANADLLRSLEENTQLRIGQHSERLTRLDTLILQMPSHADLTKVSDRMNDQSREVSRMAGELSHMNDNLRVLLHKLDSRTRP